MSSEQIWMALYSIWAKELSPLERRKQTEYALGKIAEEDSSCA